MKPHKSLKMAAPVLAKLMDNLAMMMWGMTPGQAREQEICIFCKRKIDLSSLKGKDLDEYHLSALCPRCWDLSTKE